MNSSFVLTDVLVFTSDEFIEKGYVEVEGGNITRFGSGESTDTTNSKTPIISKRGCTLLPGLIDSHIHGLGGNILSIEQSLRFGVTTTKNTINSWPKLTKPLEAYAFSIIVNLPPPSLDLQRVIVAAAHAQGLLAVGHAFSFQGAVDLLSCGVDGLTHSFIDKPTSDQHIELAKRNNARHNPTLTVCASQTREGDEMQVKFHNDPLAKRMLFDTTPRQPLALGNEDSRVENAYRRTRDMYKAGIPIMVGPDSSGQVRGSQFGLGVHMEIHAMVHKAGITVVDVFKGATSLVDDRFGFHDRGRIEVGRKADLVLVEGDVSEFLAKEDNLCLPICGVWRDGVVAKVYEEVMS
ncbi:hypothetical protein V8E51_000215 [Hyaloscypha variabilis]